MQLSLSRLILFTAKMDAMVAFYRDVMGPRLKSNEKGWKDVRLRRVRDRAAWRRGQAGRAAAEPAVRCEGCHCDARGAGPAQMGKVSSQNGLDLCGGKDPDGNPFALSNRS
jgi:catechol 2,3-dioxygenase-like lactoylglutathione lyase family enzyme